MLLKVLILQGTLSGHVRGASGQVSGGWSQRLKKRLDRATSGVGRLHQVGGLTGGCLRRAVGCREKNGRGRPVFGLVAGASFTSVGGFLLWYIGRAEVLEEGSHFGLSDRVVLIACTLLGHLQNRVAISVCNYSVPLISLVPSEVPSIPVEVSGNLHGSRREAIPDRCVTNLSSGQKLLDLNHRVPFVEGRSHTQDDSPGLSPVLCRIIRHKDSVHTAVEGQCLEHSGNHLHWVTMGREAKGLAKLRNATEEEICHVSCFLLLIAYFCPVLFPLLLKGIPL